jgi:hypothetical protein
MRRSLQKRIHILGFGMIQKNPTADYVHLPGDGARMMDPFSAAHGDERTVGVIKGITQEHHATRQLGRAGEGRAKRANSFHNVIRHRQ